MTETNYLNIHFNIEIYQYQEKISTENLYKIKTFKID